MAATLLKRTSAVWVPPRSTGERAFANEPCLIAMSPSPDGAQMRWSRSSLEALPAMKTTVLLFDARDVTLIPVKLPPLSGTRLMRALPNLVEDALLQDVNSCAIALGPRVGDEQRLLAVIDRAWLEYVIGAFERRGIRISAAWPAQLALPLAPGGWSVACVHQGLAVRTGETEGFGWSASTDADFRTEALACAIEAAAQAAPRAESIDAFADDRAWQVSVDRASKRLGVEMRFSGLPAPVPAPVDLLEARQGTAGRRWLASIDWRAWRIPAALAAGALAAFLIGLNLHWGRLAQERAVLKVQMESTFRQAFPNAQVIVDPMLQMQRQVADLRLKAGQTGPDDFLPLLTKFSAALGARGADALAGLEYRDGRLRARFRDAFLDGPAVRDGLVAACAQQGLKLQFEGDEGSTALAVVSLQS